VPRPGPVLATCCNHLHRPLAGARRGGSSTPVGAWLVITAGYSGAIHRCRRSGAVPRRSGGARAPCQPARLDHGPGSRGRSRVPAASEPAAGSWERLGSRNPGRWPWRLAGPERLPAASPSQAGAGALLAPWFGPRASSQQRSWSVGGCSRAGPQGRRPRSMTISILPSSGLAEPGHPQQGLLSVGRNPGPSSPSLRRRQTTAQTAGSGGPGPGCGRCRGWPCRPEPSFTTPTGPTGRADHTSCQRLAGPVRIQPACWIGLLALVPPSGA